MLCSDRSWRVGDSNGNWRRKALETNGNSLPVDARATKRERFFLDVVPSSERPPRTNIRRMSRIRRKVPQDAPSDEARFSVKYLRSLIKCDQILGQFLSDFAADCLILNFLYTSPRE